MTTDLALALEECGIRLKRHQPGQHRAPCPECDHGPRDDALAVRIDCDSAGATWLCHRCGWSRGIRLGRREAPWRPSSGRQERQPIPAQYLTLSPWGLDLWDACRPIEPGTVAAAYLARRYCVVPPGDLRWHANLDDRVSGYRGPALVALVTDVDTGEPVNLHRTWLAQDGAGKAEINKPRRLLKGHRSRGVIRLWPDTEVTIALAIGEGIETCLAAAHEGLTPVWATISASNLTAFPILPGIERLTVLCDHDKPNPKTGKRAGHEAALAVIERYTTAGFDPDRDLAVILPQSEGEDANDLVRDYWRAA